VYIKAVFFINVNKKGAPCDAPLVMNSNPKLFSTNVIANGVESLGNPSLLGRRTFEKKHNVVKDVLHIPDGHADTNLILALHLLLDFNQEVVSRFEFLLKLIHVSHPTRLSCA
jgi:hypothetical protein